MLRFFIYDCVRIYIYFIKVSEGSSFSLEKETGEGGNSSILHIPTNTQHRQYLAAPQSVRVFIFHFIREFICIHFLE